MEVVNAFNSNNLHTEIIIKGTYDKPLFRASDIGNVLEISTIRSVIRDFDETEKVVHSMQTLGGEQNITFLTEKGLYKVLFKSRKPIAEKFQNWVCEKKEIINVYLDRKNAAINNGYESSSSLDNHVKNESLTKGNYYMLFDKCQPEMKKAFIEKYGEPLLYKDGIGQYDSNGNLIKEFVCKYDCIKKLQISDKTLSKALDKNIMYNNAYFKTIGSKLQIVK